MREIKFRGKRVDNSEWIYGAYMKHIKRTPCVIGGDTLEQDDYQHLILVSGFSDWNMQKPIDCFEVIPETVGQYTGLKDRNGKEIYEGDIVRVESMNPPLHEIRFIEGGYCLYNENTSSYPLDINMFYPSVGCQLIERGNIHD